MRPKNKFNKFIIPVTVVSVTCTILLFSMIVYSLDTHINIFTLFSLTITDTGYRIVGRGAMSSNASMAAVKFCETLPVDIQPKCVTAQIAPYYNYTMRNGTGIRTPDVLVANGGLCRDLAVYYYSVFRSLGWNVYYNFDVPHHVFVELTNTMIINGTSHYVYCMIDGTKPVCTIYD